MQEVQVHPPYPTGPPANLHSPGKPCRKRKAKRLRAGKDMLSTPDRLLLSMQLQAVRLVPAGDAHLYIDEDLFCCQHEHAAAFQYRAMIIGLPAKCMMHVLTLCAY